MLRTLLVRLQIIFHLCHLMEQIIMWFLEWMPLDVPIPIPLVLPSIRYQFFYYKTIHQFVLATPLPLLFLALQLTYGIQVLQLLQLQ